jgi:hypothetical protein
MRRTIGIPFKGNRRHADDRSLTEDHARQEQVYENLSYNREPWIIRRDLTSRSPTAKPKS